MCIYLDNAATTKPCNEAVAEINRALIDLYGNPSSLHTMGLNAEMAVSEARKTIASALSANAENIYFTSGATESNNLAIRGAVSAYGKRKCKIVVSAVEHASVRETVDELEKKGFEVVRILPRNDGEFYAEDFINAVDEKTCLVIMMLVNNENGYIMPAKQTFTAIKRLYPDVITHCDCVQGFMKIPIKCSELNADLISISAHKIHGAKGVGALYIKKSVRLVPIMTGGKQEKGIRSGTESVPLILGFGAAVKKMSADIQKRYEKALQLKAFLLNELSQQNDVTINSTDNCSPYVINISVKGIRSEIMLHFLETKEIYVSSGSACSKGAKSGVLEIFGATSAMADSALRISITAETTEDELKKFSEALYEAQQKIMKVK